MNVQQHVGRADQVAIAIRDAEELFAKYKAPMLARLVAMSIDYRNPRFPIKHNIDAEHTLSLSCITSPKALERIARGENVYPFRWNSEYAGEVFSEVRHSVYMTLVDMIQLERSDYLLDIMTKVVSDQSS